MVDALSIEVDVGWNMVTDTCASCAGSKVGPANTRLAAMDRDFEGWCLHFVLTGGIL